MRFCLLITLVFGSGCATPRFAANWPSPQSLASSETERLSKTIYVVGHGWHTGIVLKASDVSPDAFPEIEDFPRSEYVELGWGDEGFYRAKKITAPLVLQAAFWPTPSVMHVVGFSGPVKQFYQVSDIIEVKLSQDDFDQLCGFIGDSFERTEDGEPIPLGPGLYGESTFYRAKGKYYVPKTCNSWTAKGLKAAGCDLLPQTTITAESVLARARKHGRDLQQSPRGLKKAALGGE
jgi:uncharacterized protein (TIGR02117 family)